MKHLPSIYLYLVSLCILGCLCSAPAWAEEPAPDAGPVQLFPFLEGIPSGLAGGSCSPVIIHFFYNPGCGACERIHPVISAYAENHSEVKIEYHSLAGNKTNIDLFTTFQETYNISHAHVPILFLGSTILMGDDVIEADLDQTVQDVRAQNNCAGLLPEYNPEASHISSAGAINIPVLLLAAIGEGINPCGLLVLALLLVSLMASQSRRIVLAIGLAYIVAFFAVRLLSGFAIFSIIQFPGISQIFTLIAGVIAIIAGIIQVADGIARKEKPLLSIPESKKGIISAYMKKASIPAGCIAGALVGLYGMACTAGIYISILGMLYKDTALGMLYLTAYNIVVIIPLLAILLLVFFGIPPEKVNAWRMEKKSLLRVVIGVVMILMGIIILFPGVM